jgi:pullulanase/glycogen debranching enzyme
MPPHIPLNLKRLDQKDRVTLTDSCQNTFAQVENDRDISIHWHGTQLFRPDWADNSHTVVLQLSNGHGSRGGEHLCIMMSAYWEHLSIEIPKIEGWY